MIIIFENVHVHEFLRKSDLYVIFLFIDTNKIIHTISLSIKYIKFLVNYEWL